MTPFIRCAHRFAVGFQFASLILYGYLYSRHPDNLILFAMGWSVFFGAYSLSALRKAAA